MKLCVNCRHMKDRDCHHPKNMETSMVDGLHKPMNTPGYLRQLHASGYKRCEPDGQWWESNADYADTMVKRDQLARHEGRADQDLDVVGRAMIAGM
jgi:hypothetical protein